MSVKCLVQFDFKAFVTVFAFSLITQFSCVGIVDSGCLHNYSINYSFFANNHLIIDSIIHCRDIFDAMFSVKHSAGEVIIQQGNNYADIIIKLIFSFRTNACTCCVIINYV